MPQSKDVRVNLRVEVNVSHADIKGDYCSLSYKVLLYSVIKILRVSEFRFKLPPTLRSYGGESLLKIWRSSGSTCDLWIC